MDQKKQFMKESFNINTKNNRYILKLFGEMNHEYINIEKDDILTISKAKIDNFEKKGQISKWKFNLDQIYNNDTTFEELYENEIENNDYLHEFNKKPQYRTIVFVGDRNDNLTDEPYKGFLLKCINECLNNLNNENINENEQYSLVSIVSFYEANKSYAIDYLKNISNKNNNEKKDKIKNFFIRNPKLNYYEDDIIINDISQVQISNDKEFSSLLDLSKKTIDYYKFNKWNLISKDESIAQIISLKLLKSNTNECFSKINFVLYKAYEILDTIQDDTSYNIEDILNIQFEIKQSFTINKNKSNKNKTENKIYNLYTKDNYSFFGGIQNKINYRYNYMLKYIKDTLLKGSNLFIVLLPCEYQYLLLVHDLLDNINMRKLIIENIIIDEQDNFGNNELEVYFKFDKNSELNDIENNEYVEDDKDEDISLFQSFSKNNSVNANFSSIFRNYGKNKNCLYNSCMLNDFKKLKKKRVELNIQRLRNITNKTNIIKLFGLFDSLKINESSFYHN